MLQARSSNNSELQIPLVSLFSPVSNSELSTQNSELVSFRETITIASKRAAYSNVAKN